jgi:hypothetical protein
MNVFIFFHELIWNSLDKYIDVRSNSRSRYDQMVDHSNYWQEVHPLLHKHPEKNFYLIAGDVGGNEDAIAAFYDKWGNVTLIASGMGEVADENYLLVKVHSDDSLELELVPLNPELLLPDLEYFSVPLAPDSIQGPEELRKGTEYVEYSVPEIPLVSSYIWDLPDGMLGTSITNMISMSINSDFSSGLLSVHMKRAGFGVGPAVSKTITGLNPSVGGPNIPSASSGFTLRGYHEHLIIDGKGIKSGHVKINIMESTGKILKSMNLKIESDIFSQEINITKLPKGLLIITVISDDMAETYKYLNY